MEATTEERERARALAHWWLLVRLWREHVRLYGDPANAGAEIAEAELADFEDFLQAARGRDAAVTQHLAIAELESAWRFIRAPWQTRTEPRPDAPHRRGGARRDRDSEHD